MNIYIISGLLLTVASIVSILYLSARYGISNIINDKTGKGKKLAIARMSYSQSSGRTNLTNSIFSGVYSTSAQDMLTLEDFKRFKGERTSTQMNNSTVSPTNGSEPRRLASIGKPSVEVSVPSIDTSGLASVAVDVSERTSFNQNEDFQKEVSIERTSIMTSDDEVISRVSSKEAPIPYIEPVGELEVSEGTMFLDEMFQGVSENTVMQVADSTDDLAELDFSERTVVDFGADVEELEGTGNLTIPVTDSKENVTRIYSN